MNNAKLETISEEMLDSVSGGGRGHGHHGIGSLIGGVVDGALHVVGHVVGAGLSAVGGLLSGLGGLLSGRSHH